MPVPIAAVNEDDLFPRPEHYVGLSGQVLAMEPVSIAEAVHDFAYCQFGAGVFRVDRRHDERALAWIHMVDHAR